jgi:transcriptional regulator with XRE-family HTH domain
MNLFSNPYPLPLSEFRTALGLSQTLLAQLFGVPRSNIAMAESNQRSLSTAALECLYDMNAVMAQWNPEAESDQVPLAEAEIGELRTHLFKAGKAKQKLEDESKARQTKKKQNSQLSFLLSRFDEVRTQKFNPELVRAWKSATEAEIPKPDPAKDRIQAIENRIEQACLALKIQLLEAELGAF